jgi:hypothetical protein
MQPENKPIKTFIITYPGMIINTATTARKKSHGSYDPDIIISIFTCIILDSAVL